MWQPWGKADISLQDYSEQRSVSNKQSRFSTHLKAAEILELNFTDEVASFVCLGCRAERWRTLSEAWREADFSKAGKHDLHKVVQPINALNTAVQLCRQTEQGRKKERSDPAACRRCPASINHACKFLVISFMSLGKRISGFPASVGNIAWHHR